MSLRKHITFGRALFGLGCVVVAAWSVVTLPTSAFAAPCGRDCTLPWDCQSSCLCTNFQVDPGTGMRYLCYRACSEGTQTVNKHQCKDVPDTTKTCPKETAKQCGTIKTKTDSKTGSFSGCTATQYPTHDDCTNGSVTNTTAMACD